MFAARFLGVLMILGLVATGCDDSTGLRNPLLVGDTITVAAPLPQNAGLPTALDVTSSFGIRGGRFPELARDALEWDFAVRIHDGQLVLIPAGVLEVDTRTPPGITPPLPGETIESLREAPGQSIFVRDAPMVMELGAVYAARTREFGSEFIGGIVACYQFAKMEPVEVDVEAGILRLYIITNENCGDPRLDFPN